MSLPLLKVVVFFVYVLKRSLLGVPKKVEPHPDCSQRFNSKFRPSISAPFIWEPKPNNFSPLLFLYGKCIPSFRIPHNALCLFPPPPTLPFLCINYCCQMLQGGLLIPESGAYWNRCCGEQTHFSALVSLAKKIVYFICNLLTKTSELHKRRLLVVVSFFVYFRHVSSLTETSSGNEYN